eukprot:4536709-Prymnesium_polylepis.1
MHLPAVVLPCAAPHPQRPLVNAWRPPKMRLANAWWQPGVRLAARVPDHTCQAAWPHMVPPRCGGPASRRRHRRP